MYVILNEVKDLLFNHAKILRLCLRMTMLLAALPAYGAPVKVVASFSIIGDMVHQVGGDNITLTTLVGPDGDAHMYQPTPADAKAIASADLVIVNGLGLEGWIGKLITSSGYTGDIVPAIRDVKPLSFSGEGLAQDPHAWQDVANAKRYVATIRDALATADPAHANDYRVNAARYTSELDALDGWVKSEIARVPVNSRKVITSHDAFQYYGKAYGVEFIAPLGLSTDSEASARDIAALIDQIRKAHVRALFLENMTDGRLMRQLETDGGAHIGGTLYSDALSTAGGPAPDYMAMMRQNTAALINGMLKNQ